MNEYFPRVGPTGCGSQPLTAEQQPAHVTDAVRTETLTLDIKTKRDMPAFAGYLAGTVKTGAAKIVLNVDALLFAAVDGDERGEFRRSVIDCLAHEFIHALEEKFGLLFDEEKVEAAIQRVRQSGDESAEGSK